MVDAGFTLRGFSLRRLIRASSVPGLGKYLKSPFLAAKLCSLLLRLRPRHE